MKFETDNIKTIVKSVHFETLPLDNTSNNYQSELRQWLYLAFDDFCHNYTNKMNKKQSVKKDIQ